MDAKTISIGAISVAALVVAIANPGTETKTLVAASESEADIAVTEIAKVDEEIKDKTCEKKHILLNGSPTIGWLCGGAYVPNQQSWLNKTAGTDGIKIVFRQRLDGDKVVYDAEVTRGELLP